MGKLKGQFMVISAIVIGVLLVTASSAINTAQEASFEPEFSGHTVNMVKQQASRVDESTIEGRETFERQVSMLDSYESTVRYWRNGRCFNVTLERPATRYRLECIG